MSDEIKKMHEEVCNTFTELKSKQAEVDSQVKKHGDSCVELKTAIKDMSKDIADNIAGIQKAQAEQKEKIETLTKSFNRNGLTQEQMDHRERVTEHKAATEHYLRNRDDSKICSYKSATTDVNPTAGFLTYPEMGEVVLGNAAEYRPFLDLVSTITINSGDSYVAPVDLQGGSDAIWPAETAARPDQEWNEFQQKNIPLHEVVSTPCISQKMLRTAQYPVLDYIEGFISRKTSEAESKQYHIGDNPGVPKGFLTYPAGDGGFDEIEQIKSGVAGGFTYNMFLQMTGAIKSNYTNNAKFLVTRKSLALMHDLKSPVATQGGQSLLLVPDFENPGKMSVLGYPVVLDPDMEEVATDSKSVAFGDFKQGYQRIVNSSVWIIEDNISKRGFVTWAASALRGGDVVNFEAIKIGVLGV